MIWDWNKICGLIKSNTNNDPGSATIPTTFCHPCISIVAEHSYDRFSIEYRYGLPVLRTIYLSTEYRYDTIRNKEQSNISTFNALLLVCDTGISIEQPSDGIRVIGVHVIDITTAASHKFLVSIQYI